MDIKVVVLLLLYVVGHVVSVPPRQCPDTSVWRADLHGCVPCKHLCGHTDKRTCPGECWKKDVVGSRQKSQRVRRSGRGRYKRDDGDCEDFYYYDNAIHRCTPCDHLCDHHDYQGTTQRCMEKCPDYYARMEATTSSKEERSTTDISSDDSKADATLTVILISLLLVLALSVGIIVWKRNQIWQFLESLCATEEEKTSVPCSEEEGICEFTNSKTPLTHSLGPICQPETEAHHENTADRYPYIEKFAEIDLRYAVLDEPLTSHATTPKETYSSDHTTLTSFSNHSTTPKQTYSTDDTNLTTYTSHSTIPKVVDAAEH
ncbi:uncharacterized protein [Haliotis cracherodii]|uniref:uncharacterized protein n=1 Tax=Haliotis cracherodii TaxID=6455 RepID=UPI0039EA6638